MFGEVYPDPVRVVSIGKPVEALLAEPESADNRKFSVEFCGGTHLRHTGEASAFALISEEGIAKVHLPLHHGSNCIRSKGMRQKKPLPVCMVDRKVMKIALLSKSST